MKLSQLKRAYKNLQLIVLKHKYLIPAKPIKPLPAYMQYQKKYAQQLKKQIGDSKQKVALRHRILKQLVQSNDPKYLKVKQQYEIKHKQFKQKCEKYNQLYVYPSQFQGKYRPFNNYVSKQFKIAKQLGQKTSFKKVAQKWNLLSEEEKSAIKSQSEKQKQRNINIYNEYISKHRIPFPISFIPYNLFLSDKLNAQNNQIDSGQSSMEQGIQQNQNINSKQTNGGYRQNSKIIQASKKYSQQYNNLSQEERKQYYTKANKLTLERKKEYLQFLKKWNLNQKQLKYIVNICKQYEATFSKNKKKLINEIESEQILEQEEQQEIKK